MGFEQYTIVQCSMFHVCFICVTFTLIWMLLQPQSLSVIAYGPMDIMDGIESFVFHL